MKWFTKTTQRITGLKDDEGFLGHFKGDWNRLCTLYQPQGRDLKGDERSYVPEQIVMMSKFSRLYAIYKKHKFIPDARFSNNLDPIYANTLEEMHDFLGHNPYPVETQNSADKAYNIRYKGILLIEHLIDLSKHPYRYIAIASIRVSIYMLIPVGLITAFLTII